MHKPKIIIKFGGTSVASIERIRNAAKIVEHFTHNYQTIVVVSAMAKFTNTLVEYASAFYKVNNNKEYDTLLASGEQISVGLFALALEELGLKAYSLLSWQVPIITDNIHANSQIVRIPNENINSLLGKNIIPVIAGFQGVTTDNEVTTLGRGGSDTTAVAVGVAVGAQDCYIYTDVDGVFLCDPNIVFQVRPVSTMAFEPAIEMTTSGAKVIHYRAVELAYKAKINLYIKSSFSNQEGTVIKEGVGNLEYALVNNIVSSTNEVLFTITNIASPNNDLKILHHILAAGVFVDLVKKEIQDNTITLYFTVSRDNLDITLKTLQSIDGDLLQNSNVSFNTQVAKVSIIGVGLQTHTITMQKVLHIFIKNDINILLISLANLKLTFLLAEDIAPQAVKYLYDGLASFMQV